MGEERKAAYACTVTRRIVPVSGLTLAPWRLLPGCRAVFGSEPSRLSRCIKANAFNVLDAVNRQRLRKSRQNAYIRPKAMIRETALLPGEFRAVKFATLPYVRVRWNTDAPEASKVQSSVEPVLVRTDTGSNPRYRLADRRSRPFAPLGTHRKHLRDQVAERIADVRAHGIGVIELNQ